MLATLAPPLSFDSMQPPAPPKTQMPARVAVRESLRILADHGQVGARGELSGVDRAAQLDLVDAGLGGQRRDRVIFLGAHGPGMAQEETDHHGGHHQLARHGLRRRGASATRTFADRHRAERLLLRRERQANHDRVHELVQSRVVNQPVPRSIFRQIMRSLYLLR